MLQLAAARAHRRLLADGAEHAQAAQTWRLAAAARGRPRQEPRLRGFGWAGLGRPAEVLLLLFGALAVRERLSWVSFVEFS